MICLEEYLFFEHNVITSFAMRQVFSGLSL